MNALLWICTIISVFECLLLFGLITIIVKWYLEKEKQFQFEIEKLNSQKEYYIKELLRRSNVKNDDDIH